MATGKVMSSRLPSATTVSSTTNNNSQYQLHSDLTVHCTALQLSGTPTTPHVYPVHVYMWITMSVTWTNSWTQSQTLHMCLSYAMTLWRRLIFYCQKLPNALPSLRNSSAALMLVEMVCRRWSPWTSVPLLRFALRRWLCHSAYSALHVTSFWSGSCWALLTAAAATLFWPSLNSSNLESSFSMSFSNSDIACKISSVELE